MKFLAVLIALVAYRSRVGVETVQGDTWFQRWQAQVLRWQLAPWLGLVLVVLVPTLVAAGVLDAVQDLLFGLVWIAVAAVLMLYALGRGDLEPVRERYRKQCQSGDFEAAQLSTLQELGATSGGTLETRLETELETEEDVHRAIQKALFYQTYQRWFAVLFYFVLAGPAAALAYRLLQLCRQRFESGPVDNALHIVDWLPGRLLAATFVLAGDFVRSRTMLIDVLFQADEATDALLYRVGLAASAPADTGMDQPFGTRAAAEHAEAVDLLSRSAAAWVGVLALVVLLV